MIPNFALQISYPMKKLFLSIIFAFTAFMLNAQEIKTTTWNGVERRYLEYVPATYDANTPSPVLFCLHGLGQDCQEVFDQSHFNEIAEAKGCTAEEIAALTAENACRLFEVRL